MYMYYPSIGEKLLKIVVDLQPRTSISCKEFYIVACSISAMNKPGIEEAVVLLMQHALQVNPAQPSWLRTQADIYFGSNIIYI